MTTPTTYSTVNRIIRDAYRDAGLIQIGQVPNSEQFADARNRLCDIINLEATQGLKLWTQEDLTLVLVDGIDTYKLGPGQYLDMTRPYRVLQAYYLYTTGNKVPLTPLSWNEWLNLSNTTNEGMQNSYLVNKQRTYLEVKVWLTPDSQAAADGTVHLFVQKQVGAIESLTDDLDLPIEWYTWARYALAYDLSMNQPEAVQMRNEKNAERARDMLEGWDVEDAATQLTPDPRIQQYTGGFR